MTRRKSKRRKSKRRKSPKPTNPKLYAKVKAATKRKFKVYPSAYANGWLVREYKRRGGKYSGPKPSKSTGLKRWFAEKWINVCKLPKKVACGRPKTNLRDWKKKYPYCRPSKKINKGTPKIASKLSKAQIKSRCKRKKSNPSKRITRSPKQTKSRRRKSKRKSKRRKSKRKSRRKSPGKILKEYKWMSYTAAAAYIPEAKKYKVSEVARSRTGFMGVYKRKKTSSNMRKAQYSSTQTWGRRRINFIKRHMAQYKKNKTYRRWLALVMWAYKPPGAIPKKIK